MLVYICIKVYLYSMYISLDQLCLSICIQLYIYSVYSLDQYLSICIQSISIIYISLFTMLVYLYTVYLSAGSIHILSKHSKPRPRSPSTR